jgi:hypothetical protein
MPAEGNHLLATHAAPAWTLVAEQSFAGPFVDDAIQRAVAALIPPGPWTPLLHRSVAESAVAAILYMQHRSGTRRVQLECYQQCSCAPATPCGWSFFLIDKSAAASSCCQPLAPDTQRDVDSEAGQPVVQIYLFHA